MRPLNPKINKTFYPGKIQKIKNKQTTPSRQQTNKQNNKCFRQTKNKAQQRATHEPDLGVVRARSPLRLRGPPIHCQFSRVSASDSGKPPHTTYGVLVEPRLRTCHPLLALILCYNTYSSSLPLSIFLFFLSLSSLSLLS